MLDTDKDVEGVVMVTDSGEANAPPPGRCECALHYHSFCEHNIIASCLQRVGCQAELRTSMHVLSLHFSILTDQVAESSLALWFQKCSFLHLLVLQVAGGWQQATS
jgi:hypothetical protein